MVSNTAKKSKETLIRIDGKKGELLGGELSLIALIHLWFHSLTRIQASFNYAYFQGTGYAHAIYPWFKKIFGANKEQFKDALIENIDFFNTGPAFGISAITALHIFMMQNGSSNEEAKTIKFALMGPLAGINDALFNFGSQPLIAGIAAALSADGSWTGFWFWMLVYNAFQFIMGIALTVLTYRSGQKFMSNLSGVMSSVVKIASMIGITVIAALALKYTSISLSLKNTSTILSEGVLTSTVLSFQDVLDKFIPFMLPLILVGFIYLMMAKYKWGLYSALIFILMLGITGYVFGVF